MTSLKEFELFPYVQLGSKGKEGGEEGRFYATAAVVPFAKCRIERGGMERRVS